MSAPKKNAAGKFRRRALLCSLAVIACMPLRAVAGAYEDFFIAVKNDRPPVVKSLLARGLDPNIIEEARGETGLIIAIRENCMKVFDVLLNAADVNLEAKAKNGDTALMIAAFLENKPALEALLAKGAQVNRPGWTALHYAAATGNNEIVQMLLDSSAYIDAESPNRTTPIMMAARAGHIRTVKLLLDEGADETLKNDLGMNAIDFAAQHGHRDIAEGLTSRLKKAGKL